MRRAFFVLSLIALPAPFYFVEVGRAPIVWLVGVAALTAAAALHDGGGTTRILAALIVPQAMIGLLVAWLLARLLATTLERFFPPPRRQRVARALFLAGLVLAACPIFRTSAAADGAATNLLGVFRLR